MCHGTAVAQAAQGPHLAQQTREQLHRFLRPLLTQLDGRLDLRLCRTLGLTVEAILRVRHRAQGLCLTELGRLLCSGAHTPAGVKRLDCLLHSPTWSSASVAQWLFTQADPLVAHEPDAALLIFDQSVLEKPESRTAQGLCKVRSAKARRLARSRPSFGGGKPRPVTVPGLHWLAAVVTGLTGPTLLAACHWWTTTGPQATDQRTTERQLLAAWCARWQHQVLFVWDRGFASHPLLTEALHHGARFVVRWPKRYRLHTAEGRLLPAWRLTAGQRPWGTESIWDPQRRQWLTVRFFAVPVWLAAVPTPLWLVVARGRRGTEPWRLLTTEPSTTVEQAWRIVRSYARRWQVELALRFGKSELGLESPRLHEAERRQKLLVLATLAYAFLVQLLTTATALLPALLRAGCHRTGQQARTVAVPLYRLRAALIELWQRFLPHPLVALHPCRKC